jgi:hypothetical protein
MISSFHRPRYRFRSFGAYIVHEKLITRPWNVSDSKTDWGADTEINLKPSFLPQSIDAGLFS